MKSAGGLDAVIDLGDVASHNKYSVNRLNGVIIMANDIGDIIVYARGRSRCARRPACATPRRRRRIA